MKKGFTKEELAHTQRKVFKGHMERVKVDPTFAVVQDFSRMVFAN